MQSMKETSANHLGFLVDHDIQVPAKFVDKISKRKIDAGQTRNIIPSGLLSNISLLENLW